MASSHIHFPLDSSLTASLAKVCTEPVHGRKLLQGLIIAWSSVAQCKGTKCMNSRTKAWCHDALFPTLSFCIYFTSWTWLWCYTAVLEILWVHMIFELDTHVKNMFIRWCVHTFLCCHVLFSMITKCTWMKPEHSSVCPACKAVL